MVEEQRKIQRVCSKREREERKVQISVDANEGNRRKETL